MSTKTYTTLLALLFAFQLSAQDIQISTIAWSTSSTFDVEQGAITDEINKIVSSSNEISWYGSDNNLRKAMSITGATGTWSSVSSNGSITFNVTSAESSGVVQFWKADGQTRIRIHLISENGAVLYELSVSSLTVE